MELPAADRKSERLTCPHTTGVDRKTAPRRGYLSDSSLRLWQATGVRCCSCLYNSSQGAMALCQRPSQTQQSGQSDMSAAPNDSLQ